MVQSGSRDCNALFYDIKCVEKNIKRHDNKHEDSLTFQLIGWSFNKMCMA